jgi:hypothetical protein
MKDRTLIGLLSVVSGLGQIEQRQASKAASDVLLPHLCLALCE